MKVKEKENQIAIPWDCPRMCRQGRKGKRNGEEMAGNGTLEMMGHAV